MREAFIPGEHQREMLDFWAEHHRCAWWAGMGMGKTSTALTAVAQNHELGFCEPTLVLAPLRVARSTWPTEAEKWEHLNGMRVVPVLGTAAERSAALKRDAEVYTINYDNIPWLIDYHADNKLPWRFKTLIADESTRLKNFRLRKGGQRAGQLARVAHTLVRDFIELTGTPSPNGLMDTWGQMWFIDGGQRLGRTFTAFRDRWFDHDYDGHSYVAKSYAQEQIHAKLRDVCITLDPKEYFDIDAPIVRPVYVDLPPRARMQYGAMEKKMFAEIGEHRIEAFNAAARTIKCLQLANGAAYVEDAKNDKWTTTHDAKIEALASIVEEANGAPILVAYHFVSDAARILAAFKGKARLLDQNPQTERDWNAGRIPLLVAHPASCGHGLNLQDGGNILVYFGHWWNLEERMQILERIGPVRQKQAGYDRAVFVYPIIARDTVDELVIARHETKREVQDLLLEAMKRRR